MYGSSERTVTQLLNCPKPVHTIPSQKVKPKPSSRVITGAKFLRELEEKEQKKAEEAFWKEERKHLRALKKQLVLHSATVRSSSPLDRGSEAEGPPALPLLDSPKVPPAPKTGRKQPAAISKARASVKAADTSRVPSRNLRAVKKELQIQKRSTRSVRRNSSCRGRKTGRAS
jgi:hypothetical protein